VIGKILDVSVERRAGLLGNATDALRLVDGAGDGVSGFALESYAGKWMVMTPGGEIAGSDLLIQFGVGIDRIFRGGSGVGFDVRYSIGTKNLWSEAEDNDLTAKNGVLDIKVRFFIPIEGPRS
jgi:hypothetical protein